MMQFFVPFLLFAVFCIPAIRSESHHIPTFSSFSSEKGKKSRLDSTYDSITKQFDYITNILNTENKSLSVSEQHRASVKIGSPTTITDGERKPFAYVQLWKGTYPDVLYKRARSGFVGMRGKKDSEFTEYGKKQLSGIFGMRGKKYPYEFRGKFVGVRGKKVSYELPAEVNSNLDSLRKELQTNQLMLVLTEQNEPNNSFEN